MEKVREFSQHGAVGILVRMPFDFIVTPSSKRSFDFAASPLRGESAPLRMTRLGCTEDGLETSG